MCNRCSALHVVGLAHGASDAEIKDAYRTLAKVWHPDRFQGDQRLRAKAEEKLKEINSAYQLLTTRAAEPSYRRPTRPTAPPHSPQQPPRKAARSAESERPKQGTESQTDSTSSKRTNSSGPRPPRAEPPPTEESQATSGATQPASRRSSQSGPPRAQAKQPKPALDSTGQKNLGRFLFSLGTLILFWVFVWYESAPVRSTKLITTTKVNTPPPAVSPSLTQEPHKDDVGDGVHAKRSAGTRAPVTVSSGIKASGAHDGQQSARSAETTVADLPTGTRTSDGDSESHHSPVSTNLPYFTVGSAKDDVVRLQGTPTAFTDSAFHYGLSEVYFSNGRVTSWHIYSTSPLHARMLPSVQVQSQGYFTVGSSKDEVLAVQGTPTAFTDSVFHYGLSEVYFSNGRVTSWHIYSTSPLHARMPQQ